MKVVGRFEIQDVIIAGVVETFTARDTGSGQTVLLHLMPGGLTGSVEEHFLTFTPGCPGKVLESGVDESTQRSFVITEYPRDRKALLLWIKQLTSLSAKPAPAPQEAPAAPAAATRMFDPAAIFGASPAAAAPAPAPDNAPAAATRMFDPSAIYGAGASAPPAAKAEPAPPAAAAPESGAGGATRMFDPAAIFGAVAPGKPADTPPAESSSAKMPPPAVAPKSGSDGATRMFDPAAIFGGAAPAPPPAKTEPAPSAAPAVKADQPAPAPKREVGEFTRRFERDAIQRAIEANKAAARAAQARSAQSSAPAAAVPATASGKKGPFTGLLDAYGNRIDAFGAKTPPSPAGAKTVASEMPPPPKTTEPAKTVQLETPPAPVAPAAPPASGGKTRALSTAELEKMLPGSAPRTDAPDAPSKPIVSPAAAAPAKTPKVSAPDISPTHPAPVAETSSFLSPGLILGALAVLAVLIVLFFLLRK